MRRNLTGGRTREPIGPLVRVYDMLHTSTVEVTVTDMAVDAPYPRNEEYRTSVVYNDYCRTASTYLEQAMTS